MRAPWNSGTASTASAETEAWLSELLSRGQLRSSESSTRGGSGRVTSGSERKRLLKRARTEEKGLGPSSCSSTINTHLPWSLVRSPVPSRHYSQRQPNEVRSFRFAVATLRPIHSWVTIYLLLTAGGHRAKQCTRRSFFSGNLLPRREDARLNGVFCSLLAISSGIRLQAAAVWGEILKASA